MALSACGIAALGFTGLIGLNPRHKSALAYVGEAYLDLGRFDGANATFLRLAEVCGDMVRGFDNNG